MFANRYVPFGLLLLGPVLVNILSYHTFMAPAQIPLALVATVLWFIVFFQVRNAFSGVFVRRLRKRARGFQRRLGATRDRFGERGPCCAGDGQPHRDVLSLMRTAQDCCCSHVPALPSDSASLPSARK